MADLPNLIAQLRAAAENATKGEWKDEGSYLSTSLGNMLIAASASAKCPRAGDYYECDGPTASPRLFLAKGLATYIVAAQPQNITRILDAYEAMERALTAAGEAMRAALLAVHPAIFAAGERAGLEKAAEVAERAKLDHGPGEMGEPYEDLASLVAAIRSLKGGTP